MKVIDYIEKATRVRAADIYQNDALVIVVEVPHQRAPEVRLYQDEQAYLDYYIGSIEETDHSGEIETLLAEFETYNRIDAAEEVAASDLHSWHKRVGTESILDFEPSYHQQYEVLSQISYEVLAWLT